MKKAFLFATLAVAAVVIAEIGMKVNCTRNIDDGILMFENIEALSHGEATPRAKCYTHSHQGEWKSLYECDRRTNPDTMYPCPDRETNIIPGLSDYCTK